MAASDVCNFADENTLYSCDKKLENVFVNLKIDLIIVLYWFQVNSLKANPGKFQFIKLKRIRLLLYILIIKRSKTQVKLNHLV